jgi:hypothetical protein
VDRQEGATKFLAAGVTATILAAELIHDAALPEHSPHAETTRPDHGHQAVASGASVEERRLTLVGAGPILMQSADLKPLAGCGKS